MNPLMNVPDQDKPTPVKRFWLYLLMITALAGGMRLYNLGDYSFWEDELYTVRTSGTYSRTPSARQFGYLPAQLGLMAGGVELTDVTRENVATWQARGVTEWNARIGPAVVGILTIPLLGLACRRLLGDRATLIAVLLLALSPWHLFWSQAARFYALQFLCFNLAAVWYLRACMERSARLAAQASLCLVLAFLAHPPAILLCLVLAADVIVTLVRRQPIGLSRAGWALGIGAVLVCVAFQLYDMFYANSGGYEYHGSLEGHSWKVIAASMVLRNHPVLLAAAGLAVLGLIRERPRLVAYLAMVGSLPVLALMGLSLVIDVLDLSSYVHERYCFMTHFAWIALAGLGLAALWESAERHTNAWVGSVGVAVVAVALLWADLGYYADGDRRRWKEAFAYVRPVRQPGEDVACFSGKQTPIARYYLQTEDVLPYADFPTSSEQLAQLERPTWLVLPAVSATRGELFPWLNEDADLRRYFDLRVLQPFASIRVYYYQPPTEAPPP
jgi:uncharacterized membrane protein